ncbi:MAG: hypothetical protein V1760_00695 [Candidatus Peregrinibacteria bacterium]
MFWQRPPSKVQIAQSKLDEFLQANGEQDELKNQTVDAILAAVTSRRFPGRSLRKIIDGNGLDVGVKKVSGLKIQLLREALARVVSDFKPESEAGSNDVPMLGFLLTHAKRAFKTDVGPGAGKRWIETVRIAMTMTLFSRPQKAEAIVQKVLDMTQEPEYTKEMIIAVLRESLVDVLKQHRRLASRQ